MNLKGGGGTSSSCSHGKRLAPTARLALVSQIHFTNSFQSHPLVSAHRTVSSSFLCSIKQLILIYLSNNSSSLPIFLLYAFTSITLLFNFKIDLSRDRMMGIVYRWYTKELTADDVLNFFEIVKGNAVSYKE